MGNFFSFNIFNNLGDERILTILNRTEINSKESLLQFDNKTIAKFNINFNDHKINYYKKYYEANFKTILEVEKDLDNEYLEYLKTQPKKTKKNQFDIERFKRHLIFFENKFQTLLKLDELDIKQCIMMTFCKITIVKVNFAIAGLKLCNTILELIKQIWNLIINFKNSYNI